MGSAITYSFLARAELREGSNYSP